MQLAVIILAAGKGTRMKSPIPKVLHPILGVSMVSYVVDAVNKLNPDIMVMVVGSGEAEIRKKLEEHKIEYVKQTEQFGTGHAVKCCESALRKFSGNILIVNGDFPLITTKTLSTFIKNHIRGNSSLSLLSAEFEDPYGYGRVVRDTGGSLIDVVEEKDCSKVQREIKEINSGSYLVASEALWKLLDQVANNNVQGEYYLPDIVKIAKAGKYGVSSYKSPNAQELMGVNDRSQLSIVESLMKKRINSGLMDKGVYIMDPQSTFISPSVLIGKDSTIFPNSYVMGDTVIGRNTVVGPSSWIQDCIIGNNVNIKMNCYLEKSRVSDDVQIGPFANIRPDTVISSNSRIGNFVELKNTKIGESSKVPHLSYIGDATLGKNVNIGAGSITCNYDGFKKHKTVIEDGAFIGSDTMLVAPVKVGKHSTTGAGSTITKDVGDNTLAISRAKQTTIPNWKRKPK